MRKECLNAVYSLAKKDPRVVFIGSDLGAGTLDTFKKEMPERFFMEGVSEQHLIGMSAGLAKEGFIPYFNTIATFLTRRAFEQIVVDCALHNLPVRFIASGGGLVYAPLGPTHLAIDDIAIMRTIPNMTVIAVADSAEMDKMMPQTLDWPGPIYIRLAKGNEPVVTADLPFKIGKAISIPAIQPFSHSAMIITTGITLQTALAARDMLEKKKIKAEILHVPTIKPLDHAAIISACTRARAVVTIEEGIQTGGLGSAVALLLAENGIRTSFRSLALPDEFPSNYGLQADILSHYGLTAENLAKTALTLISKTR